MHGLQHVLPSWLVAGWVSSGDYKFQWSHRPNLRSLARKSNDGQLQWYAVRADGLSLWAENPPDGSAPDWAPQAAQAGPPSDSMDAAHQAGTRGARSVPPNGNSDT